MTFYNALQMDPAILKAKIAQCDTPAEKRFYWFAMALRSLLIVGFAVVFISGLAKVFGQDNTPLAVALFCILLGIRFVNFEYCMGDSLVTLAAALAILLFTPTAVAVAPPYLAIPLHFVSFFLHHTKTRTGQRRSVQLCLCIPDRQSRIRRNPGKKNHDGSGRLYPLRHHPVPETSPRPWGSSFPPCASAVRPTQYCPSVAVPYGFGR